MKQRIYKILIVAMILTFALSGCKKKEKLVEEEPVQEEIVQEEPVVEEPPVEEPPKEETREGQAKSKITGEWIDEKKVNKRPYAFMFNNIEYASPQSGISEASILYEALAEGGITRIMGIFEDFKADRIGSARSARHYFVSFADEYDAIFVHFGQTKYALSKIKQLKVDNLSGLEGVGNVIFYRDKSIKEPHNAFASYEGIIKGTEQKKYRTDYKEKFEPQHYTFYDEDTDIAGTIDVPYVKLAFSAYATPSFVYNTEEKLYDRYQYKKEHIDKNTGKQLKFKNIIVQFVKEWNIDKNGYQTMDIENSSGNGYYITNGKAQEITWKKNESTSKMNYYDKDGNLLKVNAGKTYIAVFPNDRKNEVVFQKE